MKNPRILKRATWACLSLLLLFGLHSCQQEKQQAAPVSAMVSNASKAEFVAPVCKKQKKEMTIHGDTRTDNYYWLNDKENTEVISYLEAENTYKTKMLSHLKDFQEDVFQEMKGRIKQDDSSVPYKNNGYFYYTRFEEGKEYPIYCRKKENVSQAENILLNVNNMAEGFDFYQIGNWQVSPNNQIIGYAEDTLSRRKYTLKFKNLATGKVYPDEIANTAGSIVWANDNKTFFYNRKDSTLRAHKIFKHVLGTPVSQDEEIFHESDPTFSCYVYKTRSKKYIVIGSYHTLMSEYRVLDADTPNGNWQMIQARTKDLEYDIAHFQDKWYIRTNKDAKNFRLMATPITATTQENWTEVIPHKGFLTKTLLGL